VLQHVDVLDAQAAALRTQREQLRAELAALQGVQVFPSAANFLLLRIQANGKSTDDVFANLLERKVLVKNVGKMHTLLANCLRVNVSTPEENALLAAALRASLA
jgi:histidinol-phosphate aminotransferase